MKCLEGYIGVGVNCQSEESDSGKYLTDLAGITLQNIDAIANASQLSFAGVFKDVEKRAISRLSKDVLAFMKTQYNLKKVLETYNVGGEIGNTVSSLNKKQGIRVKYYDTFSELLKLHITKVTLNAVSIATTDITIYIDSILVYTKSITTSIGLNDIYINKSFDSEEIVVVYDSSVFADVNSSILEDRTCCLVGCNTVFIEAIQFDTIANIELTNNLYGFSCDISLRCSYDAILCGNIDIYSDAFIYALGMELMRERIYSDRVNRFTTVDKKRAEELLQFYTDDYTQFLQTANNTIHLSDDFCIECLETSTTNYFMP